MLRPEQDGAPSPGKLRAPHVSNTTATRNASIPPAADRIGDPDAHEHAGLVQLSHEAVGTAHAVLVVTPNGRYSRRLFYSLHAADAAMRRARDRGHTASCILVELRPVVGTPVIVVGGEDR